MSASPSSLSSFRAVRLVARSIALAVLAAALVLPSAPAASAPDAAPGDAVFYRLQLHDDDTGSVLGDAPTRRLLVRIHHLIAQGRVATLVKLIPKPHKQQERALFRQLRWRNRALQLMNLHLNNDQNNVVYPGFVHRCAAGSDYSRYDKADLRRLGRHVNRAHPCGSMRHYRGPIVQVNYWTAPRARRDQPYFRGLLFPSN
jgi:hypothetical protein